MRFLLVNLYALAWVTVPTIKAKYLLWQEARHLRRARELRARISYLADVRVPEVKAMLDRAEKAQVARRNAADATNEATAVKATPRTSYQCMNTLHERFHRHGGHCGGNWGACDLFFTYLSIRARNGV